MGYDVERFQNEVDGELVCPICSGVLEKPVQSSACEHAFCRDCITQWLETQGTCPVDRSPLTANGLRPVPRILKNLLARLTINCDFASHGCTELVSLDALEAHVRDCEYNPKRTVPCGKGCGYPVPRDELPQHNCVKELRTMVDKQSKEIGDLRRELADHTFTIEEMRRTQAFFKECITTMKACNPSMRAIADQIEREEVKRWVRHLEMAHVTRWSAMISTPLATLQLMLKRALQMCGCPAHILNSLAQNSHEYFWPIGMCTLEARQQNRHIFDSYNCRRIPGKQAVIILSIENTHMSKDLLCEPGMVVLFAEGVE